MKEEFEVPEGDFVLASESVPELDVSQLSSQEVALSMLDEEAVVPVSAKFKFIKDLNR